MMCHVPRDRVSCIRHGPTVVEAKHCAPWWHEAALKPLLVIFVRVPCAWSSVNPRLTAEVEVIPSKGASSF